MSKRINGPLVEGSEVRGGYFYGAPEQVCPIHNDHLLVVVGANFYGGIVSGVTWVLRCPNNTSPQWGWQDATDNYEDAYGEPRPV